MKEKIEQIRKMLSATEKLADQAFDGPCPNYPNQEQCAKSKQPKDYCFECAGWWHLTQAARFFHYRLNALKEMERDA